MLFPGYDSHLVSMAKELYDNNRIIQEYFEEASSCLGINAVKLCFATAESEMIKMSNAHIIIFLISTAIYKLLEEQNIGVELLAGHNTGVYAALFAAKSLTFPDGLYLTTKYAYLFEEFVSNLSLKVIRVDSIERAQLEEWCAQESSALELALVVAYYTATTHYVTGHTAAVDRVIQRIGLRGMVQELSLPYGIHSTVVNDVAYMYEQYLQKVDIKQPLLTVLSEIDGRLLITDVDARHDIIALINHALHFDRMMDVFALHDIIIELGSGTVLTEIIKKTYTDKHVITVSKQADINTIHGLINTVSHIR
jgi:[acyl-carrier-protein] S-malonyltransferase